MTPVYLHALGIINALGDSVASVRAGLYAGSTNGMVSRADLIRGRETCVGVVQGTLPAVGPEHAPYASRNIQILCAAIAQIRPQIDAAIAQFGADRIGIVLGSSTSGAAEGFEALTARLRQGAFPPGYDYRRQEMATPSEFLRHMLALGGPAWSVSTACTASAKAFSSGRRLLKTGLCDAVIVGGVDSLCRLTLNGFNALESIAGERCNPFSVNRDGINIGEGAAVFLMSREPGPVALLGVGESSDAYHISAPDPEGRGAETAMRMALADAGIDAGAVDYVNLHGTATVQNDLMESHVVDRVIGRSTPCSSTKPLVGHALGAAGATETGFCWILLTEPDAAGLPPHIWDGECDPALAPLRLSSPGEIARCKVTLSNSFAFGGNNACLVLGRT
ncbi:MAG TPA: beta-ketoacyl-[acyl-carrier-protein] synthase family protein [Gammaproteobacteria bacterium]|nr:beta-ketoacyl-[acyl-carrier-protein] synthase family protein [Gammaproteobacteria bacterium]